MVIVLRLTPNGDGKIGVDNIDAVVNASGNADANGGIGIVNAHGGNDDVGNAIDTGNANEDHNGNYY